MGILSDTRVGFYLGLYHVMYNVKHVASKARDWKQNTRFVVKFIVYGRESNSYNYWYENEKTKRKACLMTICSSTQDRKKIVRKIFGLRSVVIDECLKTRDKWRLHYHARASVDD